MIHRKKTSQRQWFRLDLHLHTPASADFKQANVSYLAFLKKAEERNLDAIAFTDHNTVQGYARLLEEIETLETLERLKRLRDDERVQLDEYRRLREKILIFPGFELTATLGFHVLGIFPPETTLRQLELLLLSLHVPADRLDLGSGEVGATTDVLTAYRAINQAGGLVIAAHANSSHGVAMPGFDFGGQTRIAYTQDASLHALEVTDLESKSRRRTALFFSGTKPEYPRRMHCIQGSDAHKLDFDQKFKNEMGVGDRATEMLLDELTFDAIKAVFAGNDFSRTRPYRPQTEEPFDPLREAREHGETLIQSFHERLTERRGVARPILQDVVALANTNGGTIYIGANADVKKAVVGVERPEQAGTELRAAIAKDVTPPLEVQIESLKSQGKNVLQVIVPRGSDVPYVLEDSHIYVRAEGETGLAVRDEIVQLVRDALAIEFAGIGAPATPTAAPAEKTAVTPAQPPVETPALTVPPPRTGVQVVAADVRKGVGYYSVRDLRNARIVHNVTLKSARHLWQYAITEREKNPCDPSTLKWVGEIAVCKSYKRAGKVRYDFAQRAGDKILVYYGVTDDGIHGPWRQLIEGEALGEEEISETLEAPSREELGASSDIAAEYEPVPADLPEAEPAIDPIEETLHPLIIEEDMPAPVESAPVEPRDELVAPPEPITESPIWFEQGAEPEEPMPVDSVEPGPMPETVLPTEPVIALAEPTPPQSEPEPPPAPVAPPETPVTAVVPAAPAPLVPKSRAQAWREQLERALAEARAAREAKKDAEGGSG